MGLCIMKNEHHNESLLKGKALYCSQTCKPSITTCRVVINKGDVIAELCNLTSPVQGLSGC